MSGSTQHTVENYQQQRLSERLDMIDESIEEVMVAAREHRRYARWTRWLLIGAVSAWSLFVFIGLMMSLGN